MPDEDIVHNIVDCCGAILSPFLLDFAISESIKLHMKVKVIHVQNVPDFYIEAIESDKPNNA